jgi:hypothetical protein
MAREILAVPEVIKWVCEMYTKIHTGEIAEILSDLREANYFRGSSYASEQVDPIYARFLKGKDDFRDFLGWCDSLQNAKVITIQSAVSKALHLAVDAGYLSSKQLADCKEKHASAGSIKAHESIPAGVHKNNGRTSEYLDSIRDGKKWSDGQTGELLRILHQEPDCRNGRRTKPGFIAGLLNTWTKQKEPHTAKEKFEDHHVSDKICNLRRDLKVLIGKTRRNR